MPLTDSFAASTETAGDAFERLRRKCEPIIFEAVHQNTGMYRNDLCSSSDHDDLLQVARYAFWETRKKFDKIDQNSENLFIALAAQAMNDRISDFLKKYHKNGSAESFNTEEDYSYSIPDETGPESIKAQALRLLKDRLPGLTSRETRYLNLILFDDWNVR